VWTTGEPIWLSNAGEEQAFLRAPAAASAGIHAALFVPIPLAAGVAGVLEILSQRLQPADPDVIVTLSSVASHLGHFLERQRTEEERQRILAEARQARGEAESANRAKDEFLAMLSHDLRAPLTSAMGWLNMMRRGVLDAEHQQRAVTVIERSLWSLARMIDDLLDISRIAAGKMTLVRQPLGVGPLIAEIVESLQPEASAKDLELEARLDPVAGEVLADAQRLRQVVVNLLGNALKYTPSGGRVAVRLDGGPGTATITVRDTGVGIAHDQIAHVFERFRQADRPAAATETGLGLGLAIAREIVVMHGGSVEARSDGPGRGATFIVTLPLATEGQSEVRRSQVT
jgi:signal transduction histidine kinase